MQAKACAHCSIAKEEERTPIGVLFFGMWDVQDSKGRKENMPVACF